MTPTRRSPFAVAHVLLAVVATAIMYACGGSTEPSNGPTDSTGTNNSGNGGSSTGRIAVWSDYSSSIAVTIDGAAAGSTTQLSSAPTCGQSGAVTATVAAGSHVIGGSAGSHDWSGTTTVTAGQCTVYKLTAPVDPPATTGQLSIWTDYASPISVSVDGTAAGTLSTYFSTTTPSCGQTGTITLTLPAGSHHVTGVAGTTAWDTNGAVTSGQCTLLKLAAPTGGGSGGGGGGGTSTGQLSVWTDYSNQISVKIDGSAAGTLTTYFATSTPSCGQAGTLTLTLAAGSHALSGTSGTTTWSGSPTVVAGQCTLFKLNAPTGGGGGGGASTGQISVWSDYSQQIAVRLDGTSVGTLTSYFTAPPTCGQSGTLTVTATAGSHAVAGTSGTLTWNGNVTVVAGQCTLFKLSAPATSPGQISFWSNYPHNIDISVDGTVVGTTTSYFATSTPTCGQSGTVTVSEAAGSHVLSARSGTVTWSGTVTVASGKCTLYELVSP